MSRYNADANSSECRAKSSQSATSQIKGAMSHNRLSWRRLFTTMNAAQERFTTKNTVRIGQPEAAHTKGSPVIEWIPLLRSSGIAQLGDTAIRYQIEPSRFA